MFVISSHRFLLGNVFIAEGFGKQRVSRVESADSQHFASKVGFADRIYLCGALNLFLSRETVEHGEENATAAGGLPQASALTKFQACAGTYLFFICHPTKRLEDTKCLSFFVNLK